MKYYEDTANPAMKALLEDRDELVEALRHVYLLVSDGALKEDPDTAMVEARAVCREALGMEAE